MFNLAPNPVVTLENRPDLALGTQNASKEKTVLFHNFFQYFTDVVYKHLLFDLLQMVKKTQPFVSWTH